MKRHLLTLFLAITVTATFAQNQIGKAKFQLNGGVGLSSWGFPIYGGIDCNLVKNISFGAEISYRQKVKKSDEFYIVKGLSANGNYHFGKIFGLPQTVDIYGGVNLGFFQWNKGILTSDMWNTGVQIGARYFFKNNLAINMEAGTGNAFSVGKLGLTCILK